MNYRDILNKKNEKRGGPREGAGRKKGEPKQAVNFWVKLEHVKPVRKLVNDFLEEQTKKLPCLISVILKGALITALLTGCACTYEFTKDQILTPDYVHPDSLLIVESFNLPDSLTTDEEIFNALDEFTIIYKK